MKTISNIITLFCLSALITLAGCGGGGGSTPAAVSKATVKLSTQGTLAQGTHLAGIDVVITLPTGVTVSADANNVVAAGVITVSGVAAQTGVTVLGPQIFTPATATAAGKLEFTIAAGNFGTGEFATVNFNLATGSNPPTATNVTISPADQGLHPVTTLTVALATTTS
jgi:hypothetical protein